ncbi:MAG: N-acetylmuramoyl-L-alanine amidase family protein, partial [Clostridium sp.]|nr:N-acetylmuramoyl-L-alanine amidase family protein [Clostridium sp.]
MKAAVGRIPVYFIVSFIMSCVLGLTAPAASEKIDTVKLVFSYGETPRAGEAPGDIKARASGSGFSVESAEYANDVEVWKLGDRPEVKVTLAAAEGYRFSYSASGHFKLSGCGAEFKRAKIYDGGGTLVLEAYLKRVEGKPGKVQGLEWDSSYGMWEALEEDVKHYEVRLYRDKKLLTTVTTENTVYDFRSYITRSGDYTFRVRGLAVYGGKGGDWSDYSEENTFTDREAGNYSKGTWIQNQYGWWYRYHNGDYPVSTWKNIDNVWYYFNRDGYSLNGWQQLEDCWYYLGENGKMATGWLEVKGLWYYFNQDGAMLTDWRQINGYWYYLGQDGAMARGWQQISGRWYYLNGDGVMLTGWQNINGLWYYLNGDGVMLTGWQNIN